MTGSASVCWDEEPFARGAYAWYAPGQLTKMGRGRFAAEGLVHFAGDHTSYRAGFLHGAIRSAERVVREIRAEAESARGDASR